MATLLDITDTSYPETYQGKKLRPLRGKSLLPIFQGKQREPHDEIFFEFAKYKQEFCKIEVRHILFKKIPKRIFLK